MLKYHTHLQHRGTFFSQRMANVPAFYWQMPILAPLRKMVPNVLCRCHTKSRLGACGCAHPSFGMKPTLQKKSQ